MTYIKFKRSAVSGKVPAITDIDLGELAINTYDGKLFIKKDDGTQSIVDITAGGGGGSGTVTSVSGTGTVSGLTLTGTVTTSGSLTLGGTLALTSSDITTGLGFTPYNASNPAGYTSNVGTVTSVSGTGTVNGITLTGSITSSGSLTLGGALSGIDLTTQITGVLPIANGGTNASTASAARTNLGAAASGANADITSMSGITGGISSPDFVQFDTTATVTPAAGRLYFNDGEGGLSYMLKGGNVIQEVGQSQQVLVYNGTGSTLNKGQVVYTSGAQGQRPTVALAIATSDATSARTLGIVAETIANGAEGWVSTLGIIENIDTSAFTAGAQLYLSGTTAGGLTQIKPSAPIHMVYVARCIKSHASSGRLFITVQNGYELDELHDVQITGTPTSGSLIIRDATNSLWKNARLTAGTGISIANADASVAITNSAPDQIVSLTGAGTTSISGTYPNFTISSADQYVGTVTSVSGAGTVNGLTLTGTVTGSGSLTLGGTLSGIANSALTNSTITINGTAIALGGSVSVGTVTSVGGTGTVNGITLTGSVTSSGSLTLGGTLSGVSLTTQVTGTLPVGNGGTGAASLAANNVILGNGTSAVQTVAPGTSGNVLTSNGTTWVSAPAAAGGLSQAKATAFSMILGF